MSSPPFDVAKAHRWFAIEFNNRAWELVESPARTAEETAEMLSTAHAARLHWQQVGGPLNQVRADTLIAAAYLAAGQPAIALNYAQAATQMCELPGTEPTPFDRASALGAVTCALSRLGHQHDARSCYAEALEHAANFEHADDRAVFDRLFPAP